MADGKHPAPFVETIEGMGANEIQVVADEVVSIRISNPIGSGPQGVLDLRGLRRLIETLETAEKHLTYNQPAPAPAPVPAARCEECGCDLSWPTAVHVLDCGNGGAS